MRRKQQTGLSVGKPRSAGVILGANQDTGTGEHHRKSCEQQGKSQPIG
jgi:hypothetical protein